MPSHYNGKIGAAMCASVCEVGNYVYIYSIIIIILCYYHYNIYSIIECTSDPNRIDAFT